MLDSNPFIQNSADLERLVKQAARSCSLKRYEAQFQARLKKIPPAGVGKNCHSSLLGVATLGIRAGHEPDELVELIKAAIPPGKRVVSDKEIRDAINRALVDTVPAGRNPSVQPTTKVPSRVKLSETEAAKVRKNILSYSTGPVNLDSDDFRNAHGIQLESQPKASLYPDAFSMIQLIKVLFNPGDPLYIGPQEMSHGGIDNIRTAEEWLGFFEAQQKAILERVGNTDWNSSTPSAFLLNLGMRYSHIVPNPVTGRFGKTKDGKDSLRCDDSIRKLQYAVIDFDGHDPLEKQGEILHCLCEAMGILICALIQTGGRDGCGLHAWVKIDGVDSLDTWNKKVRDGLFPTFEALGADPACANPSRGSRLPGVYRWETSAWQKLVFVSKEGVKI